MNFNLPTGDNLEKVQQSNRKKGRLKTLFDQIQSNWLSVIIILLYLFVINPKQNKRFEKIESKINISNESLTVSQNNSTGSNVTINQAEQQLNEEDSTEFNPNDWIIEKFDQDDEGFYCPTTRKFDFWSIWSKQKFSPQLESIKLRIKVKNKNGKSPPTISVNYGEFHPNYSPTYFYRLNIFDTDTKTVRLYNEKNDSVAQDWLEFTPDLSNEMTITLKPRIPNPDSRNLNLNPSLKYTTSNQVDPVDFVTKKEFSTILPSVDIEDLQNQIGIGISKNSCFKPISVEINKKS